MSKFKAGDKVRVLESGAEGSSVEVGDIGIHTGIGSKVDFPNDYWFIGDKYLELVENEVDWQLNTGTMPVEQGTLVDVKHRSGGVYESVRAGDYDDVFAQDWRLSASEVVDKDEKDSLELAQTTTQEEKVMTQFKEGDNVIINKEIEDYDFTYGYVGEIGRAQEVGEVMNVTLVRDSLISATCKSFNGNSYNFAPNELQLVENKVEEVKVEQKPVLKPFAVRCDEITAVQGNELAKLAAKAGAKMSEGLYDEELDWNEVVHKVSDFVCFEDREYYTYFGVDRDLETYALDSSSAYDDNIMSYEDAIQMLNQIINPKSEEKIQEGIEQKTSQKVKGKVPVLHQRKVKVTYTNDKTYLLKNVVSLDVHGDSETVNVVYKEKKGKVQINSNVVIPFSELKEVSFVAPESVGAVYVFKGNKVVKVILDHTREAFRTKSH